MNAVGCGGIAWWISPPSRGRLRGWRKSDDLNCVGTRTNSSLFPCDHVCHPNGMAFSLGTSLRVHSQLRSQPFLRTFPPFETPFCAFQPSRWADSLPISSLCMLHVRRDLRPCNTRYPVPGQSFRSRDLPPADRAELCSALQQTNVKLHRGLR
jgi:hypothetical protein